MTAQVNIPTLWISHVRAALAIIRRDFAIYMSYRTRPLSHLLSVLGMVVMFRFISRLVHVSMFPSPNAYFAFAVVGLVTLQVLTSTLTTPPNSLRQELVAGTFERLVLSPFGPVMSMVSMMIFPLILAIITGAVTLLVSAIVFGMPLHWATLPLALPAALLGAIAFMPFGILLAAVTLAFKRGNSATLYLVSAIGLVAGFYFPVSLLPGWIRWTSNVQPFTPGVNLMRHLLVGTPLTQSAWLEAGKLVGFTVVLVPISILTLSAAVRFGRKSGTIIEY